MVPHTLQTVVSSDQGAYLSVNWDHLAALCSPGLLEIWLLFAAMARSWVCLGVRLPDTRCHL